MIEDLARLGRFIADRLILLDALNSHYEILLSSDGSDITKDSSVLPAAMIWIHDRDRAVVVIAVQRQDTDANYVATSVILPYTHDAAGRRILWAPLPDDHPRCRKAGKEAAMALCIHRTERSLGRASENPREPRVVDYSETNPAQGDLSLILQVSQR